MVFYGNFVYGNVLSLVGLGCLVLFLVICEASRKQLRIRRKIGGKKLDIWRGFC